ncbi:MAG: Hsp70 family protein [Pirellulaceae bacterium]
MSLIIGIDLGTTNSLCSIFQDGEPRLIPNAHGDVITPSIVGVLDSGEVVVGAVAAQLRVTRPERCASCFKRWMGTGRRIEIGGQEFNSTELSSLVLRSLREDAERFLGCEVRDAVITVPAYFNDNQRKATKTAGEMAGLNVRRIINEPTAAALVYGYHDRTAEKKLIVVDLGGGTFDVTVMEVFEGTLEIISTAGETQLGGEDFTSRVVAWVLQQHGRQLETAELQLPLHVSRLREECERAKRRLVEQPACGIRIPDDQGVFSEESPTLQLTREQLLELSDNLVKRLARPMSRALRDAEVSPDDVSEVVLVGGATRSEAVRCYVEEFFETKPESRFNPDEVVALGAAVQAALIEDDAAVDDMVMTDICPFTLGVSIVKEFGRREVGGFFLPIIHRNTTIPVSREEIVYTRHPNQRTVVVLIYQGEARKVEDNLLLGELEVEGIPLGPSGQPVHLRFTYDLNGILEVEAYVPETGRKFQTVLTQHARDLSNKEVAAAITRMQQLKFYPRDDLENQHLLQFAERVVGEVNRHQREELEEAIDLFEASMQSGDKELFEHARQSLLITLSSLGFSLDSGASNE